MQHISNAISCWPCNRDDYEYDDEPNARTCSINLVPSLQNCGKYKCCDRVFYAEVVGSAHIQALAGAMIMVGLASAWMGGSGLALVTIGASIWLVSALVKTIFDVSLVDHINKKHIGSSKLCVSRLPLLKVFFTGMSASAFWATPPGWIVLATWDALWAADCLIDHIRES